MAKTRSLPLGNYPSGSRSFGPFAVPNGLKGFQLAFGRCTSVDNTIWSNTATTITVEIFRSFDGGVTFETSAKFDQVGGGIITDAKGGEIAEWVLRHWLHPADPTHIRVDITVNNGPIRTYLDVTIP